MKTVKVPDAIRKNTDIKMKIKKTKQKNTSRFSDVDFVCMVEIKGIGRIWGQEGAWVR